MAKSVGTIYLHHDFEISLLLQICSHQSMRVPSCYLDFDILRLVEPMLETLPLAAFLNVKFAQKLR
jgi:hypothetical protein